MNLTLGLFGVSLSQLPLLTEVQLLNLLKLLRTLKQKFIGCPSKRNNSDEKFLRIT